MQVTPDKDFNEAFRRKFENFEVAPSQAVWRGIASELDKTGKKVKVFPVFWLMAAASVFLVLSMGLWLFSPQEKIRLHGKTKEFVVPEESGSINIPQPQVMQQKSVALKSEVRGSMNTFASVPVNSTQYIRDQKPAVQETPRSEESRSKEIEPAHIDVQDNSQNPGDMPAKDEKSFASADQPVFTASVNDRIPATALNLKNNNQAQPRIKTITDVVTFFVGKIDPREDKLIQFRSDGDGGSAVSGINLGVFKIKSRDK